MSNLDSGELRNNFTRAFGEDIIARAERHASDADEYGRGSNQFRWLLVYCVGTGFLQKEKNWDKIRRWIKTSAGFKSYDGIIDYDALMKGTYSEFLPRPKAPKKKMYV